MGGEWSGVHISKMAKDYKCGRRARFYYFFHFCVFRSLHRLKVKMCWAHASSYDDDDKMSLGGISVVDVGHSEFHTASQTGWVAVTM